MKKSFITGFTLAEVLITLTIIGVIASLTIPALITSIQDQQYKTAYRKAFSVANQAWISLYNDNLLVPTTAWLDSTDSNANFNLFKTKFSVARDCNTGINANCWVSGDTYAGCPTSNALAFVDASGMAWSRTCYGCGPEILVDTNGQNGPNIFGKDRFAFIPNPSTGMPTKLAANGDITSSVPACPNPPCYYRSWLLQ